MQNENTNIENETPIATKDNVYEIFPELLHVNPEDFQLISCNDDNFLQIKAAGGTYYYSLSAKEFCDLPDLKAEETPTTNPLIDRLFNGDTSETNVLSEFRNLIKKYIFLEIEAEYTLLACYIVLTYIYKIFDRIPYLHLNGGKNSGKTSLQTVILHLVSNPLLTSNASPASIFRSINEGATTLLIDEAEYFETNNDFSQILNSGYQKDGGVTRVRGLKTENLSTYCCKILSGIKDLSSTLSDRSIKIQMIKSKTKKQKLKLNSEFISKSKELKTDLLLTLKSKKNEISELINTDTDYSDQISNRNYDLWNPLLIVSKVFSTGEESYFSELLNYALASIKQKEETEKALPENMCKEIITEHISFEKHSSLLPDKNFYYFRADDIQALIKKNDLHNSYRNKAEVTKILKKLNIKLTRKRFGGDPVSLYKIPKEQNE